MGEAIAELDPVLTLLVSAFLPLLLSVVYGIRAADRYKALAAFIVTVVVGIGIAWWDGNLTREGIAVSVGAVYLISQTIEARLYKPTGLSQSIETNILPNGLNLPTTMVSWLAPVLVAVILVGVYSAASSGAT